MASRSSEILPGPRHLALLEVLRVAEAVWEASRLFFAQWDLSPSQFNVLNLLRSRPEGLSQIELSRSLITHRSNVTGLVDRLEARGLLVRDEVRGDRRAYRVSLTESGRRLMEAVLPVYFAAVEDLWGGVAVKKAASIASSLAPLADRAKALSARREVQEARSQRHPRRMTER